MKIKKETSIGNVIVGGGNPISIQSMLSCHPAQKQIVSKQLRELEEVGCDIVRIAVPDNEAVESIPYVLKSTNMPVVADIHFNAKLALASIKSGVHKLRMNPSNIKDKDAIGMVTKLAKQYSIPIRVGVNLGSIKNIQSEEDALEKMKQLLKSEIDILEQEDFTKIVLSAKCSKPKLNERINRWIDSNYNYPIHIGLTEAGSLLPGSIKTAIALKPLLDDGIGNTIRVSLTGELANEVNAARYLLQASDKMNGVVITSCPTCGRCKWDVKKYVSIVEKETASIRSSCTIAMMGCEVNGPGEASEADIGMAGSGGKAVLFCKGDIKRTGSTEEIFELLMEEIKKI
ncbi:MAG: (E)-4-hydroxy-3-methylbut-2-enyl-diphosphate synthase [Caldisericia bacterium]|nr:(E)-4-hydroxy-3-methylbut-2-enyl-diphosphate synthase [Caldisericia bacterium]